jgi:hypothetical protein
MRYKYLSLILAVFVACESTGQSQTKLKPGDRPVFMTADRLAMLCQDWNPLHPGGRAPKDSDVLNVSVQQMVRSNACESYILGVMDEDFETTFRKGYHPIQSELDYLKPLIDGFLKYVNDHPEEENLAACTIIHRIEARIVRAQTP